MKGRNPVMLPFLLRHSFTQVLEKWHMKLKWRKAARASLLFHLHTSPRTNGRELHVEQLFKHTSWLMWTNWISRRPSHHVLTQASDQFMHQTVCISSPNWFKGWTTCWYIFWRLRNVWHFWPLGKNIDYANNTNCFYHLTINFFFSQTCSLASCGSV